MLKTILGGPQISIKTRRTGTSLVFIEVYLAFIVHLYHMDDTFEIPVKYKGKDLHFPARLQTIGYTHRIEVDLYGQQIFLEPDEERNYRAILDPAATQPGTTVDVELLKEIVAAIETIVK
jgi:hypothetical protein